LARRTVLKGLIAIKYHRGFRSQERPARRFSLVRAREQIMGNRIDRRQKPIWQRLRKPLPPPSKPHSTKKGEKGYGRKGKDWKKEAE